jgi:hypothetical protein
MRHPLVTILLILVLAGLIVFLPQSHSFRGAVTATFFVIGTPDGFLVINPDRASTDQIVRAITETPGEVAAFSIHDPPRPRDYILWRNPVRPTGFRMKTQVDPGWPPQRTREARDAVIDELAATMLHLRAEQIAQLRRAPQGETRWDGYAIAWNLAVWSTIALTVCSLGWIPASLTRRRCARRARLFLIGICPGCRYPVPPNSDRCPECGLEFPAPAREPESEST